MPPQLSSQIQRKSPASCSLVLKKKANAVYRSLKRLHPDAQIELNFHNPLELLVATVLSAQCTDIKVNQVTALLFKRFRSVKDFAQAPLEKIEEIIRPTGFFRQKAKSIQRAAQLIIERHAGKVPESMEELTALPGVGRKTANVILGNAFGVPGLPVDTHVIRLSNRIGITSNSDAVKIEADLCAILPKRVWTHFSHTLIFHGRRICKARNPACERCSITQLCDYYRDHETHHHDTHRAKERG